MPARLAFAAVLIFGAFAADAQPPARTARIGVFTVGVTASSPAMEAFRAGLKDAGYVEGKNLSIEFRSMEGQSSKAPALAAELVARRVEVIVTEGFPTALAAKQATTTIPIVTAAVADPVKLGLVASLRRPGTNITGLTMAGAERTKKQLQLLKEIAPSASSVAVLYNAANPASTEGVREAKAAASVLGLSLQFVEVRSPADLDRAFEQVIGGRPGGFISIGDGMLFGSSKRIAEFATSNRLPAVFPEREFTEHGALMAYGPNIAANFRGAADFVAKILKGANPAELPIEQPRKFDLVINLKTAKILGLKLPTALIVRADYVIQ